MRVLVLMHESLIPPEKFSTKGEWEASPCKTEYDVVKALGEMGHDVQALGVSYDLRVIRDAIETFKPQIVFNLLEEFAGEAVFDQNVVSYLEMLGVKYTGCNPRGLILSRDKALSKKIMAYHRILSPKFYVFRKSKKIKIPKEIQYPLFVKTLNEEASLGITQNSIVQDEKQLLERIKYFHNKFNTDAIAEDYIEGREFYVGVLGNERLKVFSTWELFFTKASERVPKIATSKVKWDMSYRKKLGIKTGPAKKMSPQLEKQLQSLSRRAYKALDISGYARMDLRVGADEKVYLIEVNPNPDIGDKEDFSGSAEQGGLGYHELLERIIKMGLNWSPLK